MDENKSYCMSFPEYGARRIAVPLVSRGQRGLPQLKPLGIQVGALPVRLRAAVVAVTGSAVYDEKYGGQR